MSELEKSGQYEGKVTFKIVDNSALDFQTQTAKYGFEGGANRHGLVVLAPDGTVLEKIDGHDFSKAEIESAIASALGKG